MNRRRLTFVHVARQSRKGKHDYQKIAVFDCHLNSRQRCHPSIAFIRFSYGSVTDTAIQYIATMQKKASTYVHSWQLDFTGVVSKHLVDDFNHRLLHSFSSMAVVSIFLTLQYAYRFNLNAHLGALKLKMKLNMSQQLFCIESFSVVMETKTAFAVKVRKAA